MSIHKTVLAVAIFACVAHAHARTPRILIVGDSWAASITAENRDGFPAPDVFDEVLAGNGLGAYETAGAKTAWGGRKASDWAKDEHLETIRSELRDHPTVDFVHLIVGGNDFLSQVEQRNVAALSDDERSAVWDKIVQDIDTIVKGCLAVRSDIQVVIAGYDYLDFDAAETFWKKDFHGASTAQLNEWLRELGDRKAVLAKETDRCEYVANWGTLHRGFGDGGDEYAAKLGMPGNVSPDGIHPNAEGHTALLQNAIDQVYAPALK